MQLRASAKFLCESPNLPAACEGPPHPTPPLVLRNEMGFSGGGFANPGSQTRMGPGSQNRGFSLANALRADVWNRLCLESATSPQQPKGWRGQPHRAGLVPPCQGTPGSLAPWGRPCHLGGVPGTSGGSLAPRGGPWQPWCRTLCDAHGAQPHYVSCSHPHWLLVPGGQDDAASSINPSRAPGVAQRDLGGAERRPQRCLCSRGGTSGHGGLW